jgi:hypothetical protein
MPSIWFDSAAVGTLGSLLTFSGDEKGQRAKPEWVAKFNGVSQALRPSATFSIEPYEADWLGPARAARASSWVRRENGKVMLVALRRHRLDGREGSGKYRDFVSATASAIVASRSGDDITRADKLAVVPYGDGEVTIRRAASGGSAQVVTHLFGGGTSVSRIELAGGTLRLRIRETEENGKPVEWLEVKF